jgi:hypothetical protein
MIDLKSRTNSQIIVLSELNLIKLLGAYLGTYLSQLGA